jgi:hypothetical protein
VNWTERILDFPVRAAAVDDFLKDLRARGTADLNAVLATLNESGLCREALDYWTGNAWILLAPSAPTIALAGPGFVPQLTLRNFCGEAAEQGEDVPEAPEEDSKDHDDA